MWLGLATTQVDDSDRRTPMATIDDCSHSAFRVCDYDDIDAFIVAAIVELCTTIFH